MIRGQTSEELVRRPSGSLFKVPFSGLYWNLDTAGVPFEDDEAEVCFDLCRCSHTKENCHPQLSGAAMASQSKSRTDGVLVKADALFLIRSRSILRYLF